MENRVTPIRDDDGNVIGINTTTFDTNGNAKDTYHSPATQGVVGGPRAGATTGVTHHHGGHDVYKPE